MNIGQFVRRYSFELFAAVAALAAITIAVAVALEWPSDWEPAAQAALAGALISLVSGGSAVFVRSAFEKLRIEAEHQLGIKARIVESSFQYSCDYLMPLAGSAGELATHISEYRYSEDAEMREHHLETVLHSLAHYVMIQSALTGTIPLPNSPRPLGLFLTSKSSEDRVWDIMVPPWVFNLRTIDDQARLVWALYCPEPHSNDHPTHLRPPNEFIESLRQGGPVTEIRDQVKYVLDNNPDLDDLVATLLALCELVNYEVTLPRFPGQFVSWTIMPQRPLWCTAVRRRLD